VNCKNAASKAEFWSTVRRSLPEYLQDRLLPWNQKNWPLPKTGLDAPHIQGRISYPMIDKLIDIAIYEKLPEQVLYWYDKRPQKRIGLFSGDEDDIATAIQTHAPDRAVDIWKKLAENLIAQVKPRSWLV
jgi:uncharacterized Zn finger protein